MKTIKYCPGTGENINNSCQVAQRMAKDKRCMISFDFNGVRIIATPNKAAVTMCWEYHMILDQMANARRMTRKYIERVARDKAQFEFQKGAVIGLIQTLPNTLALGLNEVIDWVRDFTDVSQHVDLVYDHLEIAVAFENAGYKANEVAGNSPDWYSTRERLGRWIIGQVIACLRDNMLPHQVIKRFCNDYFKLLDKKSPILN